MQSVFSIQIMIISSKTRKSVGTIAKAWGQSWTHLLLPSNGGWWHRGEQSWCPQAGAQAERTPPSGNHLLPTVPWQPQLPKETAKTCQ